MPEVRTCDPIGHLWGLDVHRNTAVRALKGLERGGVKTVADLLKQDHRDLTDIRSFGAGCLAEVRQVLAGHGLALKGEEAPGGE